MFDYILAESVIQRNGNVEIMSAKEFDNTPLARSKVGNNLVSM